MAEAIETVEYMDYTIWPRIEKRRGKRITYEAVRPNVPSNQSLSWDLALRRIVNFAKKAIKE